MRITRRIAGILALGALLWALAPMMVPSAAAEVRFGGGPRSQEAALEGPDAAQVRISFDQMRYQTAAKRVRTDTPGLFVAAALALLLGVRFIGFRGSDPGHPRVLSGSDAGGRAPPATPALA